MLDRCVSAILFSFIRLVQAVKEQYHTVSIESETHCIVSIRMDDPLVEQLTDSVRGLENVSMGGGEGVFCETSKEEGHGGGGYMSLLSPSGARNAESDGDRFKIVVQEIARLYKKWESGRANDGDEQEILERTQLKDTLPWARVTAR